MMIASRRGGKSGLYVKLADNSRNEELVIESELPATPMSWSGDRLVYWSSDPKTAGDIWAVNELSSAVRQGAGAARTNMRALIRGLYTGDGTGPPVQAQHLPEGQPGEIVVDR